MVSFPKIEDKNLLMSINALQYENDFKRLQRHLEMVLEVLRRRNDDGEGKELHQRQGACQALQYILNSVKGARETIERIKESERQHDE